MVVTHPITGKQITIGVENQIVENLKQTLELLEAEGCDFVVMPMANLKYRKELENPQRMNPLAKAKTIQQLHPFCRSESELAPNEWAAGVIGRINPWINLDSDSNAMRVISEASVMHEIEFANYVSLQAVLIDMPAYSGPSASLANFARCVCTALLKYPFTQVLLKVEISSPDSAQLDIKAPTDTWSGWNYVRSLCGNNPNLGLALQMGSELPTKPVLERWLAEPVHMFMIERAAFVQNKVGYPVLLKRHQDFLRAMIRYRPLLSLTGGPNPKIEKEEGNRLYVQYLAHLFGKQPAEGDAEQAKEPFYDFLQPLEKPFRINLEAQGFDRMDRDTVKFQKYSEALTQYLTDVKTSPDSTVMIAVIAPGRGAMVRMVLTVAQQVNRKVKIYALEKNRNAAVTLQSMKVDLGWSNVNVVVGDLRDWETSAKIDLVISDMIGVMSDNELLPEHVDEISRFLKEDAVVIPCSITSFIAPVTSPKLNSEVRSFSDCKSKWERPYLVAAHRAMQLSTAQPCFEFQLPARTEATRTTASALTALESDRTQCMQFGIAEATQLHGFIGYFEARLFNDVVLSTVPESYSHGLLSWFSSYLPLRKTLVLQSESILQMQIWRRYEDGKMWYEWTVLSPQVVPIHNPNGRSFSVAM